MTFFGLTPIAFAMVAGGAAVLLAALHLLRVRPQEVAVPTLLFWKQAVEETRARTLIKRFRHPRTWLFLTALSAVLALALAEPETEGTLAAVRHEVIVLDISESMAAPSTVAGKSRLEVARDEALTYAEGLSLRDQCGLAVDWSLNTEAAAPETPRPALLDRIRELALGPVPSDLDRAVALARGLIRGRPEARVLVWTDREEYAAPESDVPAVIRRIGGPATDMAITGITATDRLWVEISRSGDAAPREIVVSKVKDGPVLARVRADLGGAASAWLPIDGLPLDGAMVRIVLEPGDAVAGNDRVEGLLLPRRNPGTVFVETGLPPAARTLVASDTGLALVETPGEAAVIFAAGAESDLSVGESPVSFTPVTLLRETSGPVRIPPLPSATRALAPSEGETVPVLLAGDHVLLRVSGDGPRRVEITAGAIASDSPWVRDPASIGALLRVLREAADVHAGALVVPGGEPVELPVGAIPGGTKMSHPAAHVLRVAPLPGLTGRNLGCFPAMLPDARWHRMLGTVASAPATARTDPRTPPPESGRGSLRLWEGFALLALLAGILDAAFQLRGRIP